MVSKEWEKAESKVFISVISEDHLERKIERFFSENPDMKEEEKEEFRREMYSLYIEGGNGEPDKDRG